MRRTTQTFGLQDNVDNLVKMKGFLLNNECSHTVHTIQHVYGYRQRAHPKTSCTLQSSHLPGTSRLHKGLADHQQLPQSIVHVSGLHQLPLPPVVRCIQSCPTDSKGLEWSFSEEVAELGGVWHALVHISQILSAIALLHWPCMACAK